MGDIQALHAGGRMLQPQTGRQGGGYRLPGAVLDLQGQYLPSPFQKPQPIPPLGAPDAYRAPPHHTEQGLNTRTVRSGQNQFRRYGVTGVVVQEEAFQRILVSIQIQGVEHHLPTGNLTLSNLQNHPQTRPCPQCGPGEHISLTLPPESEIAARIKPPQGFQSFLSLLSRLIGLTGSQCPHVPLQPTDHESLVTPEHRQQQPDPAGIVARRHAPQTGG